MSDEFFIAGHASGLSVARGTGETWTVSTTATGHVLSLAAGDGGRLYAGTPDGVRCSDDGGTTWRPSGLEGQRVTALVCAPGAVFAGTKGPLLYRSDRGGSTWREVESFRRLRRPYWWTPVSRPHSQAEAHAIVVSPTDPEVMLVGIESGAVLRTTDGGVSWQGHRRGALRDCHTLAFHGSDGRYVYEGGAGGGAFSRDAGATWGRPSGLGRVRYGWAAAGDGEDPELKFLSVAPGVRAAHGARRHGFVVRSRGDEPWRPVLEAQAMPYALIAEEGRLYAGLSDGSVLDTTDYGATWHTLPFRLPAIERSLLHVPAA
ncbi:MAG: hypothetical protein JW767_07000 [Thermoleophilia bacterium]|nr:hypothetical protein [Thermoleophilia bacterium]